MIILKTFRQYLSLLKTTNPRKIMSLFKTYVTDKYKTQISDKNEEFFMKNKFEEEKSNIKNDNYADDLIKQLKEHWCMIDEKNKEIVGNTFKYQLFYQKRISLKYTMTPNLNIQLTI